MAVASLGLLAFGGASLAQESANADREPSLFPTFDSQYSQDPATPEGQAGPDWYQTLPPEQPGFPRALSGAYLSWGSSPTLADLDLDGTLEIIVAGRDLAGGDLGCGGMVYAYRHDGSRLWQTRVRAAIHSTPTVADITGDGYPDVVVGMGGLVEAPCWQGGVVALDGLTGEQLWVFDTQDWLNHAPDGWRDGVFSTPAIADINGDGQPEITFGAWDQCIYLLDRDGQPLWGNIPGILAQVYCGGHGFYNEDTIWSSPALVDVTGDGRLEIVIGADIAPGNVWGDASGGYLYILDADGNTLAREWMDQVIYSSPAVADLDKDGDPEFVVGTGTHTRHAGYYVSAFDYDPSRTDPADRLVLKWRRSAAGRVFPSPAIADLDKDGWLDVVITSPVGEWGEGGTIVYAWRGYDGATLFERRVCDFWGKSGNTLSSPVIADVDGDTWLEILLAHNWEVEIINHDGTHYTDYTNPKYSAAPEHPGCFRDHAPDTELTYWARYSLYASPAVGDLDADGDLEIVIGGHNPDNPNQGMLFAWTGHPVTGGLPWPTWRHDERHTGNAVFETSMPTNPTKLRSRSHTPGIWSASNEVQVTWSGAGDQGGGIAGYSIVWDTSPNTLPDTVSELGATAQGTTSPPLPDGQNLYFHLRTGDWAGNWTADALHLGPFWIDTTPPASQAWSPPLVTAPFEVTWGGSDAASGLATYTIQVRKDDGPWTAWLQDETATSASFEGQAGHIYSFRSLARDLVGNRESTETEAGDSTTDVAKHLLLGCVYDQRGQPVERAWVVTEPVGLGPVITDLSGSYALGLPATGRYKVAASHPALGTLPPMPRVGVDGDLENIDFFLPPRFDMIQNGGFEESEGWAKGGITKPNQVRGQGHTGDQALRMGALPDTPASVRLSWAITQTVSLPAGDLATLSWLYRVDGATSPGDLATVTIKGLGKPIRHSLALADAADWTHHWVDVSRLAGQQVSLYIALYRNPTAEPLILWLDEVSLGVTSATYRSFLPIVRRP